MRTFLKHFCSVLAAGAIFWFTGILLLPVIAKVWPGSWASHSEIILKPQSFPSMILGFVIALYTFRLLTRPVPTRTA